MAGTEHLSPQNAAADVALVLGGDADGWQPLRDGWPRKCQTVVIPPDRDSGTGAVDTKSVVLWENEAIALLIGTRKSGGESERVQVLGQGRRAMKMWSTSRRSKNDEVTTVVEKGHEDADKPQWSQRSDDHGPRQWQKRWLQPSDPDPSGSGGPAVVVAEVPVERRSSAMKDVGDRPGCC